MGASSSNASSHELLPQRRKPTLEGLRDYGLDEIAAEAGGRTLLSDPERQSTLTRSVGDPSTRFTRLAGSVERVFDVR